MSIYSDLPIYEKLKLIRISMGLSQFQVAEALDTNETRVSRIERGIAECDGEILVRIRDLLDVKDAPLLEHEMQIFMNRMWHLYALQLDGRVSEAKETLKDLKCILKLPFESNMCMIYNLLEIRLILQEGHLPIAEEKIKALENTIMNDFSCTEVSKLFYVCKSFIAGYKGKYKNTLEYSLKTLEHESNFIATDKGTYITIGWAYYNLGKPFHAMVYLERAKIEYSSNPASKAIPVLNRNLADCYMMISELKKAKSIHEKSLMQSRLANDRTNISFTLSRLSLVNEKMGDFGVALAHIDEALEILNTDNREAYKPVYVDFIYYKTRYLRKLKQYDQCKKLIEEGKALPGCDELDTISFEAEKCLMNLKDTKSLDYIENVVIPYYRDDCLYDSALEYCKILEDHYVKQRSKMKALSITAVAKDILQRMLFNEEI